MHLLVGLLTGSSAACRLQAARCLHQLSHSPHSSVSPACLPSTPYLLTYLSGQSIRFTVSAWRVPAPCHRQISVFVLNIEIFSFFSLMQLVLYVCLHRNCVSILWAIYAQMMLSKKNFWRRESFQLWPAALRY